MEALGQQLRRCSCPLGPARVPGCRPRGVLFRTFSLLAAMRLLIDVDGKVGVVESVAS